jgi:hypothetical protein
MTCRAHGDGCFDERLHLLSELIAAGWGATPMHLIEEALAQNGGVLPAEPPAMYRDVSVDPEYRRKRKERAARRSAVVLTQEQIVVLEQRGGAFGGQTALAREWGVERAVVRRYAQQIARRRMRVRTAA